MKFRTTIISLLSAMLIVGIVAAALLVTETKKQTNITLKIAELTSLQADVIAYGAITQVDMKAMDANTSLNPNEKDLLTYVRGKQAAATSGKIQEIRESLGLNRIDHPVYFFDEEYIKAPVK